MRLHRLEATAFGPFPGTVRVDFDDLSQAGLFLLTGPTGSGKTSVLDAVCFGLYGDVPGDRSGARQLRSDHAEANVRPRVELDCTITGRRFRITRSPAWSRPKKRGHGTTTEQARVSLSELRAGSWEPLTHRMDEAGQLITELLGMTLTQFTQVALLPQGDFQAFLRAGADARQKLLERLFRTARFRGVELWLADRRRVLARRSLKYEQRVAALKSRIAEATGSEVRAPWAADETTRAVDDIEFVAQLQANRDRCRKLATDRRHERDSANAASEQAAAALLKARELAQRQQRHAQATEQVAVLHQERAAQDERRGRLDAAVRAAPVLALIQSQDAAQQRAAHSAATADAAVTRAKALLCSLRLESDGSRATIESRGELVSELAAQVRSAVPRQNERHELQRAQTQDRALLDRLRLQSADLVRRSAELPELLAEARVRAEAAAAAAAALPGLSQATAGATSRREAAERAVALTREHTTAVAERLNCVTRVQRLTEAWLDVREQRLVGMAAEIALQLAVGAQCPVCGSNEHPDPARPGPDAPDAKAERAARRQVDDAEVLLETAADRERGLAQALAVARETAGDASVEELIARETTARDAEAAARQVAVTEENAQAEVDRWEAEQREVHEALTEHRGRIDATTTAVAERARRCGELDRELDSLRRGTDLELPELLQRAEAARAACAEAVAAIIEHEHHEQTSGQAEAQTLAAAGRAGFRDSAAVRAAALSKAEHEEITHAVRTYEDRLAAVTAVVSDPELHSAAQQASPDMAALVTADEQAATELAASTHAEQTAAERSSRVDDLTQQLLAELTRWAPVATEHAIAAQLAAFAEGKAGDNRDQMRLSAYVLAYRLGQVVDAANERLTRMSDERYLLEHTRARGAGDRRGGLGLVVRDAWSGTSRDPATLSGGETFIVSLALALGLADVVAHESGGAQLDTLFVDEGFGSLDPETLEDVMETLDGLRTGGRVVGVVSHVSEMRDRIPTKVLLHKSPAGSTLTQVNA